MAVRLNITKKGKIIILICFMLLLAGTGGYLLWRVNQEETVAPEDSEASGGAGSCCNAAGCVAGWVCDNNRPCSSCEGAWTVGRAGPSCGTIDGIAANCRTGFTCTNSSTNTCCPTNPLGTCVKMEDEDNDDVGGTCPDSIKACEWPSTVISSTCSCERCNGSNGCSGQPPTCSPGSCPSGYESCGDSTSHTTDSSCVKQPTIKCVVYHPDCNNPSNIYRYCKPKSNINTCDSGAWVTKPTGVYEYCDDIAYSATATDTDGISESSIVTKLNNTARTTFAKTTSGNTTTITETLSNSTSCLAPGSYTLDLSWADTKGATSTSCALNTTFTVQPEETNPDWILTKNVIEVCKNENTENPTAELTYTIVLKNVGGGEGTINQIVDILDSKVLATYLSNISSSGIYAEGEITWEPEDTTFAPQEQRTYTYKITVPKETFGKYVNTVTAYPLEGSNVIANAEITADCVVEAPNTGIFDSTWSKILAGIILIAIGANYGRITSMGSRFKILVHKTKISINDSREEIRKKNFEKKVVKK